VEANALMLAETCNLLLMPGRAKDQSAWVTRTREMKNAAMEAARAAAAKNTDAIFNAGTHIYQACTGCHLQYVPRLVAPASPSTKNAQAAKAAKIRQSRPGQWTRVSSS
jgi:cytochrome c2